MLMITKANVAVIKLVVIIALCRIQYDKYFSFFSYFAIYFTSFLTNKIYVFLISNSIFGVSGCLANSKLKVKLLL